MMAILKRSLYYLKGKLSRSILLCLFMLFLLLSYMLSLFYYSSSLEYRKIMVSRYPPEIALFSKGSTESAVPLPAELIGDAVKTPHITGYNTTFVLQGKPDSFVNAVTYKETEGVSALPPSDLVEIQADLYTVHNQLFTKGQAVLIDGNYPDETHPGLLIENTLADKNQLILGDRMTLSVTQDNNSQVVDLPVVGIYELESPIEVYQGNTVYCSQNSVLFMSYSDLHALPRLNTEIISVKLYLDSYDSASATLDQLNALDFDHEAYAFGGCTPIPVGQLNKSMDMVDKYISITLIIYVLVSAVILVLLLVLSLRNYYYEIGVLIAIGESRRNIYLQYILQTFVTFIVATVLSIICALSVLPKVPELWINRVTEPYIEGSLLSIFDEQRHFLTTAFSTSFAASDILIAVVFVIFIAVIFLFTAWFVIKKSNTREIFTKNDR